jgi:hypothetical protein
MRYTDDIRAMLTENSFDIRELQENGKWETIASNLTLRQCFDVIPTFMISSSEGKNSWELISKERPEPVVIGRFTFDNTKGGGL